MMLGISRKNDVKNIVLLIEVKFYFGSFNLELLSKKYVETTD